MARKRGKKAATKRGSPEAVAKRKAARALNQLFEGASSGAAIDGRTLKRKQRLTRELKAGVQGRPLPALKVLGHATELLALGETLGSLRKLKPKLPATPSLDDERLELMREAQRLYGFAPAAWRLLGIKPEELEPMPRTSRRRRKR